MGRGSKRLRRLAWGVTKEVTTGGVTKVSVKV